jgi:hypothetical protein
MKNLKVYSLKAFGSYCFGMAVVAAETQEEAEILACEACHEQSFSIDYHNSTSVTILPVNYKLKRAQVLDHFESGE